MDDSLMLPAKIRALRRKDGRVDAFTLAADGCDVLFIATRAGTSLPTHHYDTDNVTAVLPGDTIVTVSGGERRDRPGEWRPSGAGEDNDVRYEVGTEQVEVRLTVATS